MIWWLRLIAGPVLENKGSYLIILLLQLNIFILVYFKAITKEQARMPTVYNKFNIFL